MQQLILKRRESLKSFKTENKGAREKSAMGVVDLVMSWVLNHTVTSGSWLLGSCKDVRPEELWLLSLVQSTQ